MLFHVFNTQEERRSYGGSAFIEMQFCRLPAETKTKDLVAVNSINNWQKDSLYINDETLFYNEYSHIFDRGIYNNLKSGVVDVFGINYYAPSLIDSIIKRLHEEKPLYYEALVDWMNKAKTYNGFYILGMQSTFRIVCQIMSLTHGSIVFTLANTTDPYMNAGLWFLYKKWSCSCPCNNYAGYAQ